jgi:hypothetical protein
MAQLEIFETLHVWHRLTVGLYAVSALQYAAAIADAIFIHLGNW